MSKGGQMDIVGVRIMTTPRLLADLISAALDTPTIHVWKPGDEPALVTIVNSASRAVSDSRVTIVLGERLGDRISVAIDGQWSSVAPTRPHELLHLIINLAQEVSSDGGGDSGELCG
jgi:hypothetical protein